MLATKRVLHRDFGLSRKEVVLFHSKHKDTGFPSSGEVGSAAEAVKKECRKTEGTLSRKGGSSEGNV